MARILHPKCGKRFADSQRTGHCAACCETFMGLSAFDQHRKGGACLSLEESEKWWQDDDSRWHYGPRLTAEQKQERFGAAPLN